jgi:hypothetical protein
MLLKHPGENLDKDSGVSPPCGANVKNSHIMLIKVFNVQNNININCLFSKV